MTGVDDMSTQDIFGYFKEYPPAHIEWIDDASCETHTRTHTRVGGGFRGLVPCDEDYESRLLVA